MQLTKFDTVGGIPLYHDDKGAVCYKAGCTVNADGAPHAYAPDDSGLSPLDYLANAGSPGNWWGIACNSGGTPYLQSPWHPAPGFYVSTTALTNNDYKADHPSRYVDSERYCFGVIPGGKSYAKLGDVGLALNVQTGDHMFYALADVGPKDHLGEGSILLTRCLGLNPHPKSGGTGKRIIAWMVLPNSDPGYSDWETKCQVAMKQVEEWGGIDRLMEIGFELS
jgi:hypothetical protein